MPCVHVLQPLVQRDQTSVTCTGLDTDFGVAFVVYVADAMELYPQRGACPNVDVVGRLGSYCADVCIQVSGVNHAVASCGVFGVTSCPTEYYLRSSIVELVFDDFAIEVQVDVARAFVDVEEHGPVDGFPCESGVVSVDDRVQK